MLNLYTVLIIIILMKYFIKVHLSLINKKIIFSSQLKSNYKSNTWSLKSFVWEETWRGGEEKEEKVC